MWDLVLHSGGSINESIERRVESLLSRISHINEFDARGFTTLHYAVKYMCADSVQLLLENGADVNASTNDGTTPIEIAIDNVVLYRCKTTKKILQVLLEFGVDVNVRSTKGRTMLKEAIEYNEPKIIEKLLYYGADINMKDEFETLCISSLIRWWKTSSYVQLFSEYEYAVLFYILYLHVQKLLALGRYVNRKIHKYFCMMHGQYERLGKVFYDKIKKKYGIDMSRLGNIRCDCIKEIKKMKDVKINYCTTLFDVLKCGKHSLSRLVQNKTLDEIVSDVKSSARYPLYYYLIRLQFSRGLIRKNKIEIAKQSMTRITIVNLAEPCIDAIFKYLDNKDLDNLNIAADLENL